MLTLLYSFTLHFVSFLCCTIQSRDYDDDFFINDEPYEVYFTLYTTISCHAYILSARSLWCVFYSFLLD